MKSILSLWFSLAALISAAGLEFEKLLVEINAPADVATVTADFKFTNRSDKPVTIAKTDPGCSCLSVQISGGKLKYDPGESGVVRTTFDMGNFSGTVDKAVALWIDNDPADKPSMKLAVRVHIPVLIGLEPKTVKWNLGGKPDPQIIQVRMAEGKSIRVLSAKLTSTAFSCVVKTLEEGRKYDLIVTPLEIGAPGIGVIRIETDCEISKHRMQQAFAIVRKPTAAEMAAKP